MLPTEYNSSSSPSLHFRSFKFSFFRDREINKNETKTLQQREYLKLFMRSLMLMAGETIPSDRPKIKPTKRLEIHWICGRNHWNGLNNTRPQFSGFREELKQRLMTLFQVLLATTHVIEELQECCSHFDKTFFKNDYKTN